MTAGDVKPSQAQEKQGTPPPPPYSPVTPGRSQPSRTTPAASESTIAASPLPPAAYPAISGTFGSIPSVIDRGRSVPNKNGAVPALPPPQFIREPAPVPISESENPDAIALRSAITILQIQKQQALRDIQALDKLKQSAAEDPHAFASEFLAGSLQSEEGDLFHPSPRQEKDQEEGIECDPEAMEIDQVKPIHDNTTGGNPSKRLGKIPKPQNIVRMPAINWAKYHIVGEPLDKMHEEQRLRPTPGEPRHDTPLSTSTSRSPEHTLAAPYRPFVDKIEPHIKARNTGK
ncbi:hypothetical protein MGYG_05273 [Nannizzia gypsea CBS 118893]|uniref:Uncharacterized protein n=1 Tax=Arthroderma gypseum (strain ATCC MYA-4604 / CBS 118893) TaxID=535722 RepID=E4UVE5_ARTGP|nr:hypothetical protein MGYG_05273 [Nannizzia gypsea CBS 118893]EFR02272.1 hypothetical protein MGYG_05273 [Nannizzia gypsea CBS 118893]